MSLLPRDVVVALKLVSHPGSKATYADLALDIGLASSAVHRSVKRLEEARLVDPRSREVRVTELLEFLVHGVKYAYYAQLSGVVRGVPTAHGAKPLSEAIRVADLVPVWPHPLGKVRGQALKPLDPVVPEAAQRDEPLYELLALVDALRVGQPRERALASKMLEERLVARGRVGSPND